MRARTEKGQDKIAAFMSCSVVVLFLCVEERNAEVSLWFGFLSLFFFPRRVVVRRVETMAV